MNQQEIVKLSRRDFLEFLYCDMGAPGLLELYINRRLVVREAERRGIEVSAVDAEVWVTQQVLAQGIHGIYSIGRPRSAHRLPAVRIEL